MATPSEPQKYSYQSLKSGYIRLLSVLRSGTECVYDLFSVPLDKTPPFIALSYIWDDQPRDQTLFVNNSVLKVIRNVHTMLPYLVRNTEDHCLWIDGVCINQDDVEERSLQVPFMAEIYNHAAFSLIWLGKGDEAMRKAIEHIPAVIPILESHIANLPCNGSALIADGVPVATSPFWRSMRKLLSNPWF